MFTILTYAAVSVLKTASIALEGFEPDLRSASRAADILSRAALSPDHLPATQHALITRLIASHHDRPLSVPASGDPNATGCPSVESSSQNGPGLSSGSASLDLDAQAFGADAHESTSSGANLDLAGWQDFICGAGDGTPGQASYSFFTSSDWQSKSITDTWSVGLPVRSQGPALMTPGTFWIFLRLPSDCFA